MTGVGPVMVSRPFPPLAGYIREHDRITQGRELRDGAQTHHVLFTASNVRREHTGTHAQIEIMFDRVLLGYDTFNVGRSEDRGRLANRAFKVWGQVYPAWPDTGYKGEYLQHDLDWFCRDLWAEHLTSIQPELTYGSSERRAPEFRLHPFILRDGGTIVFAPPGAGKSNTLMTMAVSLDAGVSTIWEVRQTRVLFINLERSRREVESKLGDINGILGLDRERPLFMYHARGRPLPELKDHITHFIGERDIGCLLIDSISRAGMGSLIKDEVANEIVDTLNGFGIEWCALGHTSRADESHGFGSIHFDAGADITVMLTSDQESRAAPLGVGLQIVIGHSIPRYDQQVLAYEFDEAGLTGIRPARRGEFPAIEARKPLSMKKAVAAHLLGTGEATASKVAKELGYARQNVSSLFRNDPDFVVTRKVGKEVFYGHR